MKYSEVVHDLAACGAVWHFYDTQFHLLHQSNAVKFPWGSTHWELWIRAQHFNNARFSKVQVPVCNNLSSGRPLVPKGFCRKFHRGKDCLGCNFKHQCFKCGVIHPALRCNFHPKVQVPVCNNLSSGRPLVPKGFCCKFHRGKDCLGCNSKHQCFKCGVIHPALRCNFHPKVQVPVCNNLSSGRPLVPKGFCRKFHRGKDCLGCNFKHQCFKCGVIHPALRCNFHPKQSTPCTLLTSILYSGFPLHFWGVCVSFFANNLISDQQNPEIVSAKISKELAACQLAGPFDRPPFPNFRVSPLGVVPKKAPVEYRLIHHLSFPCGASVNDRYST